MILRLATRGLTQTGETSPHQAKIQFSPPFNVDIPAYNAGQAAPNAQ